MTDAVVEYLSADVRKMIAQAGLAAASHGLTCHAETIAEALPVIVAQTSAVRQLRAAIMIALGRSTAIGLNDLVHDTSSEADVLRAWAKVRDAGATGMLCGS